jgi:ribosome-associated protein
MSKLISPMEPEKFARFVVDALDDLKSVNTVTLDVRDLTDVTDYLVITSGTSSRHVKSLASHVSVEAKKRDIHPLGMEGDDAGDWVLVDFSHVVVHVMLPEMRDFYDLERLWASPEVID